MARLTIYQDNHTNSTVVSNLFIDEYMGDANDAQIKVYLYLLRMINTGQTTSVSDIADKFNHTEKDILRALKYWEKRRLMDLDYDGGKNLVGIHIRDLYGEHFGQEPSRPTSISSFVPAQTPEEKTDPYKKDASFEKSSSYEEPSACGKGSAYEKPVSYEKTPSYEKTLSLENTSTYEKTSAPEKTPSYEKPAYSSEQLREFKSRQDTALLLSIAESYIGKPLTPSEIKTILYFSDVLHFSDDLTDYLIQYCVDKGKKDFKYIEKVAVNWAESGITTPQQARKLSSRYDKNVYVIMNGLGRDGAPTAKEMEFISRWMKDYGFSTDIIVEACERTVLATDRHRFEYAEGILSSWKRQNVQHKSDIQKIDSLHQQRKKPAPKQTANRFNQFTQNSYDFDALEQELLSN